MRKDEKKGKRGFEGLHRKNQRGRRNRKRRGGKEIKLSWGPSRDSTTTIHVANYGGR